ncbi:EamA family transporter [uncultured Parolsenella sp.]|uniref:EamA family transporter n=1 Tax=uncultured Parolsenella sp. TaxID=2083008 RepID=UPI0027D96E9C|nr:EamA family transporter [uncultured Parolsenella sp.]
MWIAAAVGSALFAGLTAILAKLGIRETDSDVATALRTLVVLAFAWVMAALTSGDLASALAGISVRSYVFLALSGLATGGSWLCYFKALSVGEVDRVVPIDKSSAVLSTLLAIVLFGETGHLPVKLGATAVILVGTLLMVRKRTAGPSAAPGAVGRGAGVAAARSAARGSTTSPAWLVYAVLSALFASLTSLLAKVGIEGVDSNLATALRTCVVLAMAWGIVTGRGKLPQVRSVSGSELAFLVLSGLATGASWLCYYHAVQTGQVSVVVQIDKLSILVSVAFARLAFGERLSGRAAVGLTLIVAGTAAMAVWK